LPIYSSTTRIFEGRLGLFPGTFDPIHLGHVEIARIARERINLNAVIFIPNYSPPHKEFINHASAHDRLSMLQMAVLDIEGFFVSSFEVDAGGVSYTIHTLKHFKECYANCELFLLVGSDSLRDMHNWKQAEEYSALVKIVGISRAGEVVKPEEIRIAEDLKEGLEIIEGINMVQSSTEIKRRLREKSDLSGFLDPLVERYILKYELYQ
jgi:nicotinate-nucleotide adenylyltransferase